MRDALRIGRCTSVALVILVSTLLLCSFPAPAHGKSADEWKERTVYQIVSMTACNAASARGYSSTVQYLMQCYTN